MEAVWVVVMEVETVKRDMDLELQTGVNRHTQVRHTEVELEIEVELETLVEWLTGVWHTGV